MKRELTGGFQPTGIGLCENDFAGLKPCQWGVWFIFLKKMQKLCVIKFNRPVSLERSEFYLQISVPAHIRGLNNQGLKALFV